MPTAPHTDALRVVQIRSLNYAPAPYPIDQTLFERQAPSILELISAAKY